MRRQVSEWWDNSPFATSLPNKSPIVNYAPPTKKQPIFLAPTKNGSSTHRTAAPSTPKKHQARQPQNIQIYPPSHPTTTQPHHPSPFPHPPQPLHPLLQQNRTRRPIPHPQRHRPIAFIPCPHRNKNRNP